MGQTMKDKLILQQKLLFLIMLFSMTQSHSQNVMYKLHFRHIDACHFVLPLDTTVGVQGKTSFQLKRFITNSKYISQIDKVIDSCSVLEDTLKVFFEQKDMQVIVHSRHHNIYEHEMRGVCNHKHNFTFTLPLSQGLSFDGNYVMLQSFGYQYYFKRTKKNRYQYLCSQFVIDMDYLKKYGIQYIIVDE